MSTELSREFAAIHAEGETLLRDVEMYLGSWPDVNGKPVSNRSPLPADFLKKRQDLKDRAHRWFNKVYVHVLPYTTYDRRYLNLLLRRAIAAIGGAVYQEQARRTDLNDRSGYTVHDVESDVPPKYARQEAAAAFELTFQLIRTASPLASRSQTSAGPTGSYVPGTAFILMWMDPARPELVDVHEGVKDVFSEFGIRAYRADDIQHQDRITDLVLENIRSAEFLFADMSGERPNVYYEVGYAHALGKRPILYRRAGTPLHFDLSVHNVPEYQNITNLRKLLRARLEAITGKKIETASSGSGA
jgi:hypothetical protein